MTNDELIELVDKYNNSFWLSRWYAFLMWYYYGTVANALRIAESLNKTYSSFQENTSRAGTEMKYRGRGSIGSVTTVSPTTRRKSSRAALDFKRTERVERDNYQQNNDDDDNDLMDAAVDYAIVSSFGSSDNVSRSDDSAPFDGGGDFGGGGAGGSWDDSDSDNS